jgi:glycosyltransferase involved in cell wall biosynthesis
MKRIWILNHYAVPPAVAGGTRHYDLASQLVRRGFDVTIFASSFHHKQRRVIGGHNDRPFHCEDVGGVKFVWLRTFPYKGNDWRRIVNMASYLFAAYRTGRRLPALGVGIPKPDVIIGSSVHLLAVLAADRLARHFNAHFVMEVRDLWPQTLVDLGALSERSLLTRALRALERYLYQRAEQIVVLLPHAAQYITALGIKAEKITWIPNGVDLSRFPVSLPSEDPDGKFIVMYLGAHGRANSLRTLLDTAGIIQERGNSAIQFVFVGDGPEKPRLADYRDRLGLKNTEFLNPVPKAQVPYTLQQADALIVALLDLDLYKYGVSLNKLFDYLASARPILMAGDPADNIVEAARCGLWVPPEKPQALAGALIELYQMPFEERVAMGRRGRAYVEQNHDFAVLAQRLSRIVEALDNGHLGKQG